MNNEHVIKTENQENDMLNVNSHMNLFFCKFYFIFSLFCEILLNKRTFLNEMHKHKRTKKKKKAKNSSKMFHKN